MKNLLFTMMVMMITSTTFSQDIKIANVQLGNTLEQVMSQCNSLGYKFVERINNVVVYEIPNNDELCTYEMELKLFADTKTDIVWFGIINFKMINSRETNVKFSQMYSFLKKMYGKPYEVKRGQIVWDGNYSFVYIKKNKKTKRNIEYSVVNTQVLSQL